MNRHGKELLNFESLYMNKFWFIQELFIKAEEKSDCNYIFRAKQTIEFNEWRGANCRRPTAGHDSIPTVMGFIKTFMAFLYPKIIIINRLIFWWHVWATTTLVPHPFLDICHAIHDCLTTPLTTTLISLRKILLINPKSDGYLEYCRCPKDSRMCNLFRRFWRRCRNSLSTMLPFLSFEMCWWLVNQENVQLPMAQTSFKRPISNHTRNPCHPIGQSYEHWIDLSRVHHAWSPSNLVYKHQCNKMSHNRLLWLNYMTQYPTVVLCK